ncbi:MAG: 4Fe-4S binding protein [Desulfobacterales bacterium]|nr:4Fe-4S binding protein [Desulfobacterales bacterium]
MAKTKLVLSFPPSKVEEPITYHLIKDYDLMVNILRASIDPLQQGRMVVDLTGDEKQISRGLDYLKQSGVEVEPLTGEIRHLKELCTSCTACVPFCPTKALDVDRKSWLVSYDPDKCVVCHSCVEVCIYSAVEIYPQ